MKPNDPAIFNETTIALRRLQPIPREVNRTNSSLKQFIAISNRWAMSRSV